MCFFEGLKFQMYPEAPALHEIYHLKDESDKEYKARRKAQRAERAAGNKIKNQKSANVGLKKVAER